MTPGTAGPSRRSERTDGVAVDRGPVTAFEVNVGRTERWISGIAGALLLGYGLRRRRYRTVLAPLGLGLIGRAVSGRSVVNRALGRSSAAGPRATAVASLERGEGTRIEQAVIIARPAPDLFRFWRQFDTLPRFMENLESVTLLDERHPHWVAKGPLGARVEWDAEIHNEIPDALIAWRALPGSAVDQAGSVHFTPVTEGTEVRLVMRYAAPAGKVGEAMAHLVGDDPGQQMADDLRRFKQVMEAGEVST